MAGNVNRTPLARTPIAIVGMASIFPMAKNLQEFWDNIVNKIDCITDVPASRWSVEDYYDPDPTAPDKTYCKRGGFIPDIDFDPLEFGLPPNILEVTDVSQLLALVVARDALADSGYLDAPSEIRERIGVVLGASGGLKLLSPLTSRLQYPVWERVLKSMGMNDEDVAKAIEKMKTAYIRWEENSFPGALPNVIAGRVANRLDLGGMNCTVDAACASSMAAMKLAISDLTEGRADMMLTGGVDLDNSIFAYICFSKTPAFSKGEHVRTFDEESDGMMVGEGVGMVVLKRLEDAERDGDRIYAVIRGLGASSDGRYKSIYAPRGEGQELALKRAYEDAELSPMDVQLFEAHGTGTVAGDTTETTTAVRFFNQYSSERGKVALGSVKSQIGHTKGAAGVAGVIKAALALHQQVLPPTINVENPNPKLGLAESPLYLNTEARPWIMADPNTPRRAGVSSFGFGGTNYHFVLEEHRGGQRDNRRLHKSSHIVLMNAATPNELLALAEQAISALNGDDAENYFLNLARESKTMQIPAQNARLGFAAADKTEAADLLGAAAKLLRDKASLEEWAHPKGVYYRRSALDMRGKVVALFSGQGAQYIDMGREITLNFPPIRESYAQIDGLFKRDGLQPVSEVVFPSPAFTQQGRDAQAALLQRTDYVQPAIGAMSAGLFRLFQAAGFQPDFTAGHSFGELTALWAAGALSDADYYTLVKARGLAMAPPADANFDAGTMMAVTGNLANLQNDLAGLNGVYAANINSPKQVVIAGGKAALEAARPQLEAKGYTLTPLSVSAAFHTPLVGHAQKPFAEAVQRATFNTPRIPVYSNASAQPYPTDPAAMRQTLSDHILNSVNFRAEVENLYAAGGTVFIEFGPRNILTNLVKEVLGDRPHVAVALNGSRQKDSDRQLREAVAQLRVLGLNLGDIDPYALAPAAAGTGGRKKGMTVKINGAAYVSEKTRQGWRDALSDGYQLTSVRATQDPDIEPPTPAPQPEPDIQVPPQRPEIQPVPERRPEPEIQPPTRQPDQTPDIQLPPRPAAPEIQQPPRPEITPPSGALLVNVMEQFTRNQTETLRAHEQYLANQADYIRTVTQLANVPQSLAPEAAAALSQSLAAFHAHQAETLRVHEDYLRQQSAYMQALIGMMQGGNVSMAAPTPPQPLPIAMERGEGERTLAAQSALTPLSAATPAASGTVPQVEGEKIEKPAATAAQSALTPLPPLPQVEGEKTATPAATASVPVVTAPAPVAPSKPAVPSVDTSALSSALLDIVADKTGYPSEMLELEMDIEADLGVDSIKRVEILGAMRDRFPALPQLKPEELAELRTLAQIVDYMQANAPAGISGGTAVPVAVAQPSTPAPAPVALTPQPPLPQVEGEKAAPSIDTAALSNALLDIVADKTGYPSEMLELEMDIEADLGVDSIKRVEILGAMRDRFPALPQLKPEELAELRTLAQIVDYMQANASAALTPPPPLPQVEGEKTASPPQPLPDGSGRGAGEGTHPDHEAEVIAEMNGDLAATVVTPGEINSVADTAALSVALLDIVADKTGYPSEMLELDMDIEADLGVDSIKRVEILGAMRDRFPELPQLKPEELAELRTLAQIVDFMKEKAGGVVTSPNPTETGADQSNGHAPAAATNGTHNAAANGASNGTNGAVSRPLPRLEHDIPVSPARLHWLPQPDSVEVTLPTGGVCLLTDDGTALIGEVAARLTSLGWQVVVLQFPADIGIQRSAALPNVTTVMLAEATETHLQTALETINAQHGKIAAFVHLNAPSAGSGIFIEREKAVLKHVFLLAKHLKKPITESAVQGYAAFVTVARLDGQFGTAGGDYGAIGGGLFGLAKSLKLEWPQVFCRGLDIAASFTPAQAADTIVAELRDPNRLLFEVAVGAQGRYTLVAEQEAARA
ncbi:MAG: beta-ketoacyl synthase N-terminal-like domain-containing protein [bacterium]|nr:beta-ketoacyl synthase N-terminal-like domain-containing protein [bacterium]